MAMLLLAGPAYATPRITTFAVLILPPPQTLEYVSSPRPNQTLSKPPETINVTFSRIIQPDNGSIKVYDPYNNPLPVSDFFINGATMSVKMPPLVSGYTGTYRVEWQAACVCSAIPQQTDNFYFTIQ